MNDPERNDCGFCGRTSLRFAPFPVCRDCQTVTCRRCDVPSQRDPESGSTQCLDCGDREPLS